MKQKNKPTKSFPNGHPDDAPEERRVDMLGDIPDGIETRSPRRNTSKKKTAAPPATAKLHRNLNPLLRRALIVAAYLCAFIVLDFITKQFEELRGVVAWYPPAGLTYALLLVFGIWFTPAVTVALFLSSIFIYHMPQPPILLFLWALIISMIYSLTTAFLRKWIHIDWQLRKFRDVTWFIFTTVLVSALLAVLSVTSSALSSAMPRSEVLRAIFHWWIGEAVGVLSVTPFLLIYVMPGLKRFAEGKPFRSFAHRSFPTPMLSTIGQAASIVLTLYWVFGTPLLEEYHPLFLIALPLIWIALQRGFKGISLALLALNAGVVFAMWFFRFDLARLGELELLMIVNCVVGLLMGAIVTERKQAELTMQKSEEHFRLVTDNMQDLVVRTDLQGLILYASPSNKTVLGYEPEFLLGKSIYDFMYPEDIGRVRDFTLASLQAKTPGKQEFRYRHADGHSLWLESNGAIIFDEHGSPAGAVFSSRDITGRKRTEAERQVLLEIMQGVASTGSLDELLELIRQSLAKVIYAENFFVVFQNKDSGLYEEVYGVDKYDPPISPSKLEKSITSYVFRSGEPLLLNQVKFNELAARGEVELIGTNSPSWLGVPLKTPDETIGVMAVQNYEDPDCYSERDKEFLTSVSAQVALAIERKRTEEALHESEEKYRGLVTEMSDGIFVTDNRGILTFANLALARIHGFNHPDQLLGKTFQEFIEPSKLDEANQYFKQVVEGEPPQAPLTTELVQPHGPHAAVEVLASVEKSGGKTVGTHGVIRDITERKRAEEALLKSERRFRALVEHSMEEISLVNLDGTLIWESPSSRRPLGYPPNSFVGHNLFDLFHPDDRTAAARVLEQIGEHPGSFQEAIFRLRHQDGSWRWMEGFINNLLDEPAVQSVVINYRDITERKRAEEKLEEEQILLRTLIDNLPDVIYVMDDQGRKILANKADWQASGGKRMEDVIGKTDLEIYPPELASAFWANDRTVIDSGISVLDREELGLDSQGKSIWLLSSKIPLRDAQGKVVGLVGIGRDITERKHGEEALQSRTDELSALYQLSRLLADANELAEVIDLVNRQAVESVHTTLACIALMEDGELVPRAVYPVRNLEHDLIISDQQPVTDLPVCQRVLKKNEPVIVHTDSSEISSLERKILFLDFVQSVCLVPLWVGEASGGSNMALGLLILGEARQEKREPFTPEKIRLARSIGDQAASVIRRMRLHEQAGRRLQQLASLSEIDRTIASVLDLRLSLQLILKHVCEQLAVDAADVLVFNDHLQTLEFTAGRGFRSQGWEGTRQRLGEGQAGKAALKRQIVQIPDVAASQAVFARPELIKTDQVAAYIAMPLITKGKVKGVLEIYQRAPLNPNEEWLDFLKTLAGQAAIAIDNVQMFEGLQRSTDELELAYDATIEGWSHALDLRDKETEGHTQRVTEMAVKLARSFGLREADLVQVRWGALLHDIGKMGVPDAILLKPGALTDEEWVVMKKHPTFAYEMLAPIHYLRLALEIPYCHHEKWDGTGYPRGLKGEQISLVARIFAVVDVWDAVTSDRPYRHAWSKQKARKHIQAGAGTHFDAKVVETFLLELAKR